MSLEDLQKHIDKIMNEQNNRVLPEFEGYSPQSMHHIIHFTFGDESPIRLQRLSDNDYAKVPLLNQIKYLMELIAKTGEIKLTSKGYLPTKVVAELYEQGFIKDDHIEMGISKLYKETDSMSINITRILLELAGLVKKRSGKLSLTKVGTKMLKDNEALLKKLIETFALKFNWAYYDGYGDNSIGQMGYGFSLILLSKYGNEKRLDSFYADKYFKAFPRLLEGIEVRYGTVDRFSTSCYSIRVFDRFLDYFGVINIEETRGLDAVKYVSKTDLFDKMFKILSK